MMFFIFWVDRHRGGCYHLIITNGDFLKRAIFDRFILSQLEDKLLSPIDQKADKPIPQGEDLEIIWNSHSQHKQPMDPDSHLYTQ